MLDYEFQKTARTLDLKRLLKPLLVAERAMARLDENLRALPFRDGVIERLIYHEACAVSLLEGQLVPIEDLVQFEAGCLHKISYPELSACHGTYVNLRDVGRAAPETLLAGSSPGERRDRPRLPEEERNALLCDLSWGEAERLSEWQNVRREAESWPALLAAGFVWDAWQLLQPEQHGLWKSYLLASLTLKARKAFGQGLLPLAWGAMHADIRWDKRFPLNLRLEGFLEAVKASCERTGQEIIRLSHADALMERSMEGKKEGIEAPAAQGALAQ